MDTRKETQKSTVVVTSGAAAIIATLVALAPIETQKPPKVYPGPYPADVLKITDSDTYKVRAHIWPGHSVIVGFRINGVDTPEKFRPKCDLEKFKAIDATRFVESRIAVGSRIQLTNVFIGKFGGRAVGDASYQTSLGWRNIGSELISEKYAVTYHGKKKTKDWCKDKK